MDTICKPGSDSWDLSATEWKCGDQRAAKRKSAQKALIS